MMIPLLEKHSISCYQKLIGEVLSDDNDDGVVDDDDDE